MTHSKFRLWYLWRDRGWVCSYTDQLSGARQNGTFSRAKCGQSVNRFNIKTKFLKSVVFWRRIGKVLVQLAVRTEATTQMLKCHTFVTLSYISQNLQFLYTAVYAILPWTVSFSFFLFTLLHLDANLREGKPYNRLAWKIKRRLNVARKNSNVSEMWETGSNIRQNEWCQCAQSGVVDKHISWHFVLGDSNK